MFLTVDAVWAPDETQPVVAVLDPVDGSVRGLLDWADLPPAPVGDSQGRCAAGGETFWVQQGQHLLALKATGSRWVLACPGLTLLTAGPFGVWLADLPRADSGLLFHVPATQRTGGLPTPITLDRSIRGVQVRADGLEVTVLSPPLPRLSAKATPAEAARRVHTHLLTWAALEQPHLRMAEHPEITSTPSPDVYPWLPEAGARWQVDGQEWHLS